MKSGAKTGGRDPGYVGLARSGELARRAEIAKAMLAACHLCPRNCRANRLKDELGTCRTGRQAVVSSCFAHHGEESCLRGRRGSGTIFFAWCNLRCVFCQNSELSWGGEGEPMDAPQLAAAMLQLQEHGCHNVNLVTPTHVVPQVLEALVIAAEHGLKLPVVYNTSAYDALPTLELLDGVVAIYMPDFKFWDPEKARRYLNAPD
jgi:putative pyruvate formate lyase activating enzyme